MKNIASTLEITEEEILSFDVSGRGARGRGRLVEREGELYPRRLQRLVRLSGLITARDVCWFIDEARNGVVSTTPFIFGRCSILP